MSDLAAVLKAVEAWPVADQLELVHRVWDRLVEAGGAPAVTAEQKAEFDRRLAALDANPDDVITWDAILAHVKRAR